MRLEDDFSAFPFHLSPVPRTDCVMNLIKITGAVLAVLLVATSATAAMPGGAPVEQAEQANNQNGDERAERTGGADHGDANATDDAREERAGNAEPVRGPPTDMPEQVPDFVSQIHDLVQQKLAGDIANLGERISDLTLGEVSDGGPADGTGSGDADPDNTTDSPDGQPSGDATPTAQA